MVIRGIFRPPLADIGAGNHWLLDRSFDPIYPEAPSISGLGKGLRYLSRCGTKVKQVS